MAKLNPKQFSPGTLGQVVATKNNLAQWVGGTEKFDLDANRFDASTQNGATGPIKTEIGASDDIRNIVTFDFSQNTQQFIEKSVVLPSNYDGQSIQYRVKWIDSSAAGAGGGTGSGVTWSLEARAFDDSDAINTPWGDPTFLESQSAGIDQISISDLSAEVTIAGNPVANGLLSLRVSRDPDATGDDLDKPAGLISVEVIYGIKYPIS